MAGFVANIGGQYPLRFRKTDGVVSKRRAAEILSDRAAGCSRQIRTADAGTLADYEKVRAPAEERRPSIVPLELVTTVNLGDWVPEVIRGEVEKHIDLLQRIPFQYSSVDRGSFLDVPVSFRLGRVLKNMEVAFLADILRLSNQDLLKTKDLGRKGIKELGDLMQKLTEIISEQQLTDGVLGDWIKADDLREKVRLYQHQIAPIKLAERQESRTGNWWRWVFCPPGIEIPVRLQNCLRRWSSGARTGNESSESITALKDILALSTKDLLNIMNFGSRTLWDLRAILQQIIDKIEQGDYSWLPADQISQELRK